MGAFQHSAAKTASYTSVALPRRLSMDPRHCTQWRTLISKPIEPRYHQPEEEIAYGPACWLWDYLRRSGASGFLLPLSGGADSASSAAIVGIMCAMVERAVNVDRDLDVIADITRIFHGGDEETAENDASHYSCGAKDITRSSIADRVLTTVYMD